MYLNVGFFVDDGEFTINSNAKNIDALINMVESFLQLQAGRGIDNSDANVRDEYTITLELDLSSDTFASRDNTGNKGLRDGILMKLLSDLA